MQSTGMLSFSLVLMVIELKQADYPVVVFIILYLQTHTDISVLTSKTQHLKLDN